MEEKKERIPLGYNFKEFVSRSLREVGNRTLEMAKQAQAMTFEEDIESALLRNFYDVIARYTLAF